MRTSPRVLLAWEHDRYFGHRARLDALAREFEDAGAEVVCALPKGQAPLSGARAATSRRHVPSPTLRQSFHATNVTSSSDRSHPAKHVQSPGAAPHHGTLRMAPQSYADVLVQMGMTDVSALHGAVSGWTDLYATHHIDHVVIDTAPAAQLAALLCRIPAVHITAGFDAPPPECPLFGIGLRGPMLEDRKRDQLAALDHAFTAVAQRFQLRAEVTWRDWLAYPSRWLDVVAETDPYGPRDDALYIGPIGEAAHAMPFTWPERVAGRARVFCYVRDATTARATIAALRSIGSQSLVVWPDAPHADRVCAASAGITVIPHPVHLSDALSACDIVVNYGSPGLVTHAVLTGKPQLMIPLDVEKYLVARRVEAQGLGVMVRPDAGRHVTADGIRLALVRLLSDRETDAGSSAVLAPQKGWVASLADLVAGILQVELRA